MMGPEADSVVNYVKLRLLQIAEQEPNPLSITVLLISLGSGASCHCDRCYHPAFAASAHRISFPSAWGAARPPRFPRVIPAMPRLDPPRPRCSTLNRGLVLRDRVGAWLHRVPNDRGVGLFEPHPRVLRKRQTSRLEPLNAPFRPIGQRRWIRTKAYRPAAFTPGFGRARCMATINPKPPVRV